MFTGASAAAALAVINGLGNVGGYFGEQFTGISRDQTGGYDSAIAAYGVGLELSAAAVFAVTRTRPARGALAAPPVPSLELR